MKKNKKVLLLITLLMCFISFKEVKADEMNPRYATVNGTYLWLDGKIQSAGKIEYGIDNNSNKKINFCISPDYYSDNSTNVTSSYYYGYIDTCSTGYQNLDGWWQSSGTGYAQLLGWLDTNVSCSTNDGYLGHKQKLYFRLVDFTTPSGGADFSWSCFQLANDNANSGYYNIGKILNITLTEKDYYKIDKAENEKVERENQSLGNQQTIIDQNNQTNSKLDSTNSTLTSDDSDTTSSKCGVVCKLKGIFTGIKELPTKIIDLLIDALKSLFVPTEEQLQSIIKSSSELSENFGFVGQTIDFFLDIFTSLLGMVNGNGCITMPEFKIGATTLFESHVFWKEQRVCLADNVILNDNIDTIRIITSISLVCMFLGFASRQFFKILSKSESESDN